MKTTPVQKRKPSNKPKNRGRKRLPVTVLSGFLGAGRTTLLNPIRVVDAFNFLREFEADEEVPAGEHLRGNTR